MEKRKRKNNTNQHLDKFIESFVNAKYKERWKAILKNPKKEKAKELLKKFEHHLNDKEVKLLESHEIDNLAKTIKDTFGFYYDGETSSISVTFQDAYESSYTNIIDVIFSIIPGKYAYFFFHEGWGWECRKV